ncbi:hypothetical protein KFE25_003352 [Diacronema lutheri]|uniref:Uncharacterized protein n=1 Tax=Diacronema lutheri TaxID=2081491 RepID=A0A8J6C976_DIALT|nr:hypothetical protein KFE25_003352 [Diacronema lutheri]
MGRKPVERALYKALRRAAEQFDRNVALRALLTAVPQKVYHRSLGRVVDIESSALANSVIEHVVRDVNAGADFHRPDGVRKRARLATETLRRYFREPPPTRLAPEMSQLDACYFEAPGAAGGAPAQSPLDAGFEVLRWLNSISSAFEELPVAATRPVRVSGFGLKEDQCAAPCIGDVLLTHPIACLRQPTLHQAAILLAEGGEVSFGEDESISAAARSTAARGVMGIVLNRPTRLTLGQLLEASEARDTNALLGPFRDNVVYVGGDVMRDRLLMLHPFADVADAARIVDGVFMSSDLGAVNDAVLNGKDPRRFKVFVGHCGWAAEQLKLECERGVWFAARGAPGAVARLAVETHCFLEPDATMGSASALTPIVAEAGAKEPQYLESADRSVYTTLLGGFSEEHCALTLLAGHDADVLLDHLHATVERHVHSSDHTDA